MLLPATVRLVTVVVANVAVPLTNAGPDTVSAEVEALPREEVAVAVIDVKDGLAEILICVDVPINTLCPPTRVRLDPTVREPKVAVPVPPRDTASSPVNPNVKFCAEITPVMLVSLVIACTTFPFNLPAANVPLKAGMKVRVLAVVVEMLMEMLVSEVVATEIAGPVKPETEVMADVK